MSRRLAGIGVPGEAAPWEAVGFTVADDRITVANGALLLGEVGLFVTPRSEQALQPGPAPRPEATEPEPVPRTEQIGSGYTGVREADLFGAGRHGGVDLEGIPIVEAAAATATAHPNGAFELDHLVLLTDSLERTSEAVHATLDLECRRIRETSTVRQAFHRFADVGGSRGCIIEIVERPGQERTALMGVVFNVADLDALADRYDDAVMSRPKDAVQPGRRIAAFRRGVGLPTPVAVMTRG